MKIYKTMQMLADKSMATCKIVVRFKKNDRVTIATKTKFPTESWSQFLGQVVGLANSREINNSIEHQFHEVQKVAKEVEKTSIDEQKEVFIKFFSLPKRRSTGKSEKKENAQVTYFNDYLKSKLMSNSMITLGTYKNHRKIIGHFNTVCPLCKFTDINSQMIDKINQFCTAKKYVTETAYNFHKTIKCYLKKAIMDGLFPSDPVKNPYNHCKIKRDKRTTRAFLTDQEVDLIYSAKLPDNLDLYRDAFLFLCYTGLRISDFLTLNQSMLKRDILVVEPQKTSSFSTVVHLPLKQLFNGKPYEIWAKYDFNFPLGRYFDLELNKNIKIIANMIGLDKKLTCHVARHSFLTNIAIKTKNLFTVMKLGGLRKTDTAMIYIHIAEMEAGDMLKEVIW